ncbi:hypothetical protein GC105_13260 [Alkalibaculum sp. M08DMB]|uniref:Lipoprotein n=1 Tax=Alkalibaculum sporogenes TaxID=2655001 RepID=A0A6A7KBG9_9FIRM|nr:hypothetical protein [Alkalibaculum sporogenes]MPW26754.1 hypothetical protein [Alkalibaculum sporogenes]
MKKLSLLLMICIVFLAGCSGGEDVETNKNEVIEPTGYVFEDKGVTIAMHAEAEEIIKKMTAIDYFEAESCAFQGMEKIYTYNGYELHTYELDGVDRVATVMLLDDSVSTKEGIYLYSTLEDVIEAYGDKYTENLGVYTYELDDSKISFMVENEEVISIEYIAIAD